MSENKAERSPQERLFDLLNEQKTLETKIEQVKGEATEIAKTLCTEAGMTEISKKKSIKFNAGPNNALIVVQRRDTIVFDDPNTQLKINAAKAAYEAKIKPFKDEHAAAKKMIEVQAINAKKAHKKPSYFARFDSKDTQEQKSEDE